MIHCEDTNENPETYELYLKTKHWLKVHGRYRKNHPKICSMCQHVSNIHLHHLTYDRIGREVDSDLIWLCKSCHKLVHSIPNKGERISVGRFILDTKKECRKHKQTTTTRMKKTPMQPKPQITRTPTNVPSWYVPSKKRSPPPQR